MAKQAQISSCWLKLEAIINANHFVCRTRKFEVLNMREATAHWILMHQYPFFILEEEVSNLMNGATFELRRISH